MKNIFSYLTWSNPKSSANSLEQTYYDHNAILFNTSLAKYNDNTSLFGIIKSDIILQGLSNKKVLDDAIKKYSAEQLKSPVLLHTLFDNLTYFTYEGTRIYIPTYNPQINLRYYQDLASLQNFPYNALLIDKESSLINPFEFYNYSLFNSPLTRLIKLDAHDEDSQSFYHVEFETIFVIENQGTLQVEIPIFDDKLKKPNKDNLFDRINTLMTYYYANDRENFINAFKDLNLISNDLFLDLKHLCEKRRHAKEKHYKL